MQPMIDAESVQKICLLAPTEHLAETARQIIQERGDHVDVFVSNYDADGIALLVSQLVDLGAEFFISRKGTKEIIEQTCGQRAVGLNNTLTDYLRLILEARKYDGLVAIFTYDPVSDEVLLMCELLNVKSKNYIFKSLEDCYELVREAIADGAVYGIGGAWTERVAKTCNFPHSVMENSTESIVNALEVAQQILRVQQEEYIKQQELKTQLETYQAVLNSTHDAILSVDGQGMIQIANPVAERIIGRKAKEMYGQPVSRILPDTQMLEVLRSGQEQLNQIMEINHILTNTNRIPIIVDETVQGVVATFQDVRQLQSSEQKIRLKLHEKGLVAKYCFSDILGDSQAIRSTIRIARSYASSNAAVLITGETGVGKELFAQGIHNASHRSQGPFVAINCAAVSNNLLESELFGYEEGAFTGASKGGRPGLFELAHGGTIFLDEIGEISKETQAELLRVLQEKEVRRVGGSRVIPVDVRVLTATNKDLLEEVVRDSFREDLYYRLNVLDLKIPPLRERGQDTLLLGLHFFRQFSGGTSEREAAFLSLLRQVEGYAWYGNIRELQNFAERVQTLLRNNTETFNVMTEMMRRRSLDGQQLSKSAPSDLQQEREVILAALRDCGNAMDATAKSLGYSRQTLWRKMRKYNITR